MDLQNNTIDSIQISGPEYVIIKNLGKKYQEIKEKLIEEILREIHTENNENNENKNT